jgi:hypothetical protein
MVAPIAPQMHIKYIGEAIMVKSKYLKLTAISVVGQLMLKGKYEIMEGLLKAVHQKGEKNKTWR